ncbi:5-oxoprolinase subunit PxpB [bacterium SCSIO 12696]|nr:5-oxoprolinase subunit PxpB [bacterium SCSIO 12696]
MVESELSFIPAGEEAALVYFAEWPSEQTLEYIHSFCHLLEQKAPPWLLELVPSYTSVMVYYDVTQLGFDQLKKHLTKWNLSGELCGKSNNFGRELEIPVYYGEEVALDIKRVEAVTGMSRQQIVDCHSNLELRVYALGFRPGFGFMGTLPPALVVPRLDTPRQQIPKGAVAIAETQTAIYPDISPGGWNIIGRCPIPMFDRSQSPPCTFLNTGDKARFVAISRDRFLQLAEQHGGVVSL